MELLLKPQSQDILSERDLCHNTGHLSLTPSHPDTHDCYPLSSCGSVVLLVFPATCTHAPCYFKHDLWQALLMFISKLWWLQFSQGGGLKHKWARCVRVPLYQGLPSHLVIYFTHDTGDFTGWFDSPVRSGYLITCLLLVTNSHTGNSTNHEHPMVLPIDVMWQWHHISRYSSHFSP